VKGSEIEVGKEYAVVRRRDYCDNDEHVRRVTVLSPPKKGLVHVRFDGETFDDGSCYLPWEKARKIPYYRSFAPFTEAHIPVRHFISEWAPFEAARRARREAVELRINIARESLERSWQLASRIRQALAERGIEANVLGERSRLGIGEMGLWLRIDTTIECERFEALLGDEKGTISLIGDDDGENWKSALVEMLSDRLGEGEIA
jgi:hypothetical protein